MSGHGALLRSGRALRSSDRCLWCGDSAAAIVGDLLVCATRRRNIESWLDDLRERAKNRRSPTGKDVAG